MIVVTYAFHVITDHLLANGIMPLIPQIFIQVLKCCNIFHTA